MTSHCLDCISHKIRTFLGCQTLELFPFSVSLNLVEDLDKLDSWCVLEKREFSHCWRNHCQFLILLWKSKFVRWCLRFKQYGCHLQYILYLKFVVIFILIYRIRRKKLRKFQDFFWQLILLRLFWRMSPTAAMVCWVWTVIVLPKLLLLLFKIVLFSCGYNEELISVEGSHKNI